jgi:hypothetical protein
MTLESPATQLLGKPHETLRPPWRMSFTANADDPRKSRRHKAFLGARLLALRNILHDYVVAQLHNVLEVYLSSGSASRCSAENLAGQSKVRPEVKCGGLSCCFASHASCGSLEGNPGCHIAGLTKYALRHGLTSAE